MTPFTKHRVRPRCAHKSPRSNLSHSPLPRESEVAVSRTGCSTTQAHGQSDYSLRSTSIGMLHMKNIRELKFSESFVDAEHWRVIAALESLEDLSFDSCEFLQGPLDVEPEERVKVKVSRLQVIDCTGQRQPIAAIHPQHLRTLVMDFSFDQVEWLPQSSLIELHHHLPICCPIYLNQNFYSEKVHTPLTQLPQSLVTLWLFRRS
ncbi:hypothetical protein J3R82DRAFT_7847 [Butyriboletus roseoflavus]|nr:hypothetical protein J3R82DRAFT_7847 [Butyriboletus roseoflavus]